jgi:hypothetical protein
MNIQQSQIGFRVELQAYTTGTTPLSGSINTMVLVSPTGTRTTYPCAIDPQGLYAFYVTNGSEFAATGVYKIQLETTYGSSVFYSATQTVNVLANL